MIYLSIGLRFLPVGFKLFIGSDDFLNQFMSDHIPFREENEFNSFNILQNINGIKFVFFSKRDVVRHKLVQKIIQAYEELEEARNRNNSD